MELTLEAYRAACMQNNNNNNMIDNDLMISFTHLSLHHLLGTSLEVPPASSSRTSQEACPAAARQ